jgi:hypothetical protein
MPPSDGYVEAFDLETLTQYTEVMGRDWMIQICWRIEQRRRRGRRGRTRSGTDPDQAVRPLPPERVESLPLAGQRRLRS